MKALSRRLVAAALPAVMAASPARGAVDVQLVGRVNLPNSVFLVNVVGYVDQSTLREYAIVGDNHDKVYIVDVTTPADARITAQIDGVPGFDVKTWDHYLYTCDGNTSGNDSRVIDISDPASPIVIPAGFPSAHTLQISPGGIMFAEFPGLRIYDLATPASPTQLFQSGGEGHDSTPKGTDRLYDFHGRDGTVIWNVADPANPDTLGVIDDPSIVFHHSGDVTEDQRYLYLCDELASGSVPDITIWDIQDPASPVRVGQLGDGATVHNIYVVGDLAYVAYYSAGFRVYDLANPTQPVLAGQYDTSKRTGEGFIGAIGAYVYLPSGNVLVCDIENGLFVFTVTPATLSERSEAGAFHLKQNVPNPFNPSTRIPFELTRGGRVTLSIFDVAGRHVRSLVDRDFPAGTHETEWDGRDDAGQSASSGVYFYRLQTGSHSETRRMVLVK
ncbi:MAG TPA: choice-of-anchor B family protein [Candidatus Krumholzibacteria bacterium]|nr:choice-of-anchor B family protein [Candidatus Krumholzibacteria bacterium]